MPQLQQYRHIVMNARQVLRLPQEVPGQDVEVRYSRKQLLTGSLWRNMDTHSNINSSSKDRYTVFGSSNN